MKNNIKSFGSFIKESHATNKKLSDKNEDEIRVYEEVIRNLFSFVGEGIEDILAYSETMTGKWKPNTDEYQNEIVISFIDNAWGGISQKEWSKASNILKEHEGKNGFETYSVSSGARTITLEFDNDVEMGLY